MQMVNDEVAGFLGKPHDDGGGPSPRENRRPGGVRDVPVSSRR
jgi:hypothetical protein